MFSMKSALWVSLLSAVLVSAITPVASANNRWAGDERSGSCFFPNYQTRFGGCEFGAYRKPSGARQIGGFYVNPTADTSYTGYVLLQYRTNNGDWQDRRLELNATSGNYIDFGDGVNSFSYRFPHREQPSAIGGGGITVSFRMNYDLDR